MSLISKLLLPLQWDLYTQARHLSTLIFLLSGQFIQQAIDSYPKQLFMTRTVCCGTHTICRFSLIWWDYVKKHGCVDVSHTFSMRKWVLAFILSFFVCMFDSKYIIAPICRLSKRLARLRGTCVAKCFGKLCLNWGDSTALKSIRHRNWIYRAGINDCFEGFRKVFWC